MDQDQSEKIKPSEENTVVEVQYEEVCSIPETGGHCIVLIKPRYTENDDISGSDNSASDSSGTQSSDLSSGFRLRRKITTHRRR